MAKKCELNCKSEGPPGPIWCTVCGHDPRCCTCEDWEQLTEEYNPYVDLDKDGKPFEVGGEG